MNATLCPYCGIIMHRNTTTRAGTDPVSMPTIPTSLVTPTESTALVAPTESTALVAPTHCHLERA
ncbi:MAG: hypothetical protein ABF780_00005, partial [Bifidobacterium aquikefiri]|uniref:hypothetical protein n=1 Tax=Bifidobacterium aquikefiri TaxID=1653207 RepID=UPI0039EBFE00